MGLQLNGKHQVVNAPKLPHPFVFGSAVSITLGIVTLTIEMQNMTYFQSPLAATVAPILIFGYFPITFFLSPGLMAIIASVRYHNTKGLWWYFGGSAIFGFIFSFFIVGFLFLAFIMSGPP